MGDPFLAHPVGDGDNGQRGDGDDGEHDGSWGGLESPLVATDAESGAGETVDEDPDPVRAPFLYGLGEGCLVEKVLAMGEFGNEQADTGQDDPADDTLVGGGDPIEWEPGTGSGLERLTAQDCTKSLADGSEDTERDPEFEPGIGGVGAGGWFIP